MLLKPSRNAQSSLRNQELSSQNVKCKGLETSRSLTTAYKKKKKKMWGI